MAIGHRRCAADRRCMGGAVAADSVVMAIDRVFIFQRLRRDRIGLGGLDVRSRSAARRHGKLEHLGNSGHHRFFAALQLGEIPAPHEIQGMLLVAAALALLSYLGVRQHRRDDPVLGQE